MINLVLKFIWNNKSGVIIALLLGYLMFLANADLNKNKEISRLTNNQYTLFDSIHTYKTNEGKNAAIIKRLELTKEEFKQHESKYLKEMQDLKIKLKYVSSLTSLGSNTSVIAVTPVKDSVVQTDKGKDTLKCFTFKNNYIEQNGCISLKTNLFKGSIEIKDTVDIYVVRIPKKFLFFKYGTKSLEVNAVNKNPYTKIVSGQFIDFNSIKTK